MSEECTCYNAYCHWLPLDGKGIQIWSTQIWDRENIGRKWIKQSKNESKLGSPFALTPWKQSWLYNWQTKQKTLFYMELISTTTHAQVSKISEFINISKMKLIFEFKVWLNPSWVDCAKYLAVTTYQFCFCRTFSVEDFHITFWSPVQFKVGSGSIYMKHNSN